MAKLIITAFAKVNLFLEVLRKRPDAYHDIKTILQEIDLFDKVTLKESSSPEIIIHSTNPDIPLDSSNLAFKAACLFKKHINEKKKGVVINLEKNIPIAAGLGGGSSDAAATLNGLNKLWKINLGTDTLSRLAKQIGMDVPFFIKGGLSLATGRGEKLSPLKSRPLLWFVLAIPSVKVSTAWAYNHLSISPLTTKIKENRMLKALRSSDAGEIGKQLFNRLETVTMKRYSEIASLKEEMLSKGARGALMSGSGPAVFGIFSAPQEAYKIRDTLQYKEDVYVVRGK